MRQIEKQVNQAIKAGKGFHGNNTTVETGVTLWDYNTNSWREFAAVVRLHGNIIAAVDADGCRWYSCAGWHTSTTRSRLAALGAPVRIKDFTMIRTDTGDVFPSKLTKFDN